MNNNVVRTILVVAGVVLFVAGAGSEFGLWELGAPLGYGLLGLACWLAATL